MINELKFIDLFAGIGGFRIALEHIGCKCIFSSEIDKFARKTYQDNFGDIPEGDITKINEVNIPKHDILCAGFPCQAFSISGKQGGFNDIRGTMFFEIVRIVRFHKPKIIFLENVANLKKHDDGNTIKMMANILEKIGYKVFYKILNASEFGVPQSRKRIYFVCFISNLGINDFVFPQGNNQKIFLEDILLPTEQVKKYILNLENKKVVLKNDIYRIKNQTRPIRIGTINKGGQGDRIYSPKGHAITLSAYGGGTGSKTGAYLIDGVVRKLAPEECKRVQGFPEGYKISVSDQQAWKQFGNSVAVPVLIAITENIKDVYNKHKCSIK